MITPNLCCLFLNRNDRKLKHQQDMHSKKLFDLGLENSQILHDPDKVNFNYSSHILAESDKSLLCKGLNFGIPPTTLEYADYLLPFELLSRDIHNVDISNVKKEVLKTRIKHCAFFSFNSYNQNEIPLNLTPGKFEALKSLSKNKNLIIQKLDKGNSIAIIDKGDSKFTQVSVAEDKDLENSEVLSKTI